MMNESDQYQDIRDAIRQLCMQFPDSTNLIFSYVAEHLLGLPRSF